MTPNLALFLSVSVVILNTDIILMNAGLQSRHVQQAKPQYCSNVCMKVNAKLGGSNVFLANNDHPLFQKAPTILIGADVSHAAPGTNKASFASMVGSTDCKCPCPNGFNYPL